MVDKSFCRVMVLILIIFLIFTVGCSDNNEDEPGIGETINNAGSAEVKLYRDQYDNVTRDAVIAFNSKYKGQDIHASEELFSGIQELRERLVVELMAGKGPDVIIIDRWLFNSINKIIGAGVFCDLQSLIERDESFDMSIYNKVVFDSGMFNKKRYFIPIDYQVPVMWTIKDVLEEYGIAADDENWTWEKLLEFLDNARESNEKEAKYILSSQDGLLTCLLLSSGIEYIDYDKKRTNFDSPQFIKMLEVYKKLYDCYPSNEVLQSYKNAQYDMFEEGSLLSVFNDDGSIINPKELWMENTLVKHFLNADIKIYLFPSHDSGNNIIAMPNTVAAINNNSTNKTGAFEFIKILLDDSTQTNENLKGLPVNNNAFENMIKMYEGDGGTDTIGTLSGKIPGVKLPEDLAMKLRDITGRISKCQVIDTDVFEIIFVEALNFIDDKVTAEQAAKKINDKVLLYINE